MNARSGDDKQQEWQVFTRKMATGSRETELAASGSLLPRRSVLEARIEEFLGGTTDPRILERLRPQIHHVLQALYDGVPLPSGSSRDDTFAMLEVVVVADGARPIFFFEDGKLVPGAGNGPFVDLLNANAGSVATAAQAVGRIESDIRLAPSWTDRWFAGTGFLIAPDLIMTNRHVMEAMVNESASSAGPFTLNGPYWINFDAEFGANTRRRHRIASVVFAGPDVIGNKGVSLDKLDIAVLRLGAPENASATLPEPLPLRVAAPFVGEPVYIPGYPGRPKVAGAAVPDADGEVEEVLIKLFDQRYGGKRCGSGEIDAQPGFDEDTRRWALKHDVSTLGGNSGSPILSLSGGQPHVVGIHFGGRSRVTNYGHVFEQLEQKLRQWGVGVA